MRVHPWPRLGVTAIEASVRWRCRATPGQHLSHGALHAAGRGDEEDVIDRWRSKLRRTVGGVDIASWDYRSNGTRPASGAGVNAGSGGAGEPVSRDARAPTPTPRASTASASPNGRPIRR